VQLGRWSRRASALIALGATLAVVASVADARPPRRSDRLARNWQEMNPTERERARENLQRYQRLPESGRQRMDRSYESWRQLDQRERERVQRNYQKYREMTPDQRRDFENRYKRWKRGKDR
jgi:hypothetical protein